MKVKKRRGIGKPFPRLSQDKLNCIWCSHDQNKAELVKLSEKINNNRFCYACDYCTRSLQIYRSKSGHFSVQNNTSRYLKYVAAGTNRIPYEKSRISSDQKTNREKPDSNTGS